MRRSIDIMVTLIATLIILPVALLVALMILMSLGWPIIYSQQRSGKDGRQFTIFKFRTMRPPAFENQDEFERRARVGDFLRAASLDEIPQLWNILRGDMSIIGPRPTLPEQVAEYTPLQLGRLAIRPGLTGWAQVNGRNSISWPERIELDLWYIAHRSPSLDAKILVRTVASLLRPRDIYGKGGVNPEFPTSGTADPVDGARQTTP